MATKTGAYSRWDMGDLIPDCPRGKKFNPQAMTPKIPDPGARGFGSNVSFGALGTPTDPSETAAPPDIIDAEQVWGPGSSGDCESGDYFFRILGRPTPHKP